MASRLYAIVSACAAVVSAGIFLAIAVHHGVYAPGARQLQQHIASYDDFSNPILNSPQLASVIYIAFRKSYGAVAFAIVGFLLAPIFGRSRRVLFTAILLGGLHLVFEITERVVAHGDTSLESAFDIVTGAAAGALGALAFNAIAQRREKTR